jgi:hypothetical protein
MRELRLSERRDAGVDHGVQLRAHCLQPRNRLRCLVLPRRTVGGEGIRFSAEELETDVRLARYFAAREQANAPEAAETEAP